MHLDEAIEKAQELITKARISPNEVSDEELHDALAALRTSRLAAASSTKTRTKAVKEVDLDELFGAS